MIKIWLYYSLDDIGELELVIDFAYVQEEEMGVENEKRLKRVAKSPIYSVVSCHGYGCFGWASSECAVLLQYRY